MLEKTSWIKDLVRAEQQMEESGMVDMSIGMDTDRHLISESIQFLLNLKTEFIESSSQFNELKTSALGRIKIYGIAKTHADFMLFRNGFKMIFSLKAPGVVSIRFNFIGNSIIPQTSITEMQPGGSRDIMAEHLMEAKWGAFSEVFWTYQGQSFKTVYLIRHYMTLFIRESTK